MNLIERDKKFVWHPFTQQKNMTAPIAITNAKGSLLFDENNNQYIDAISSWWVNVHGHAHEYIAQKIYEQALQLEHIIFAGFTHEPAVTLAERLLKILPGSFSKIFYSDDGSTSTEVAIKMSIQYWWNVRSTVHGQRSTVRNKLLAFKNSYHGDTFGSMSVSDRSVFTLAFHDVLLDVIFVDTPEENNINSIKEEITNHADSIAAFIYEPLVQGAGGMKMYNAVLMDELLLFIREKNIICIADEVMTGFGRTAKMFASDYLQTKPDIICSSKGLTGGTMALGVTACTENIYNAFVNDDAKKTFFHGHSFTANPIACAAANASLDLFEKNKTIKIFENNTEKNFAFAQNL
jgi:adenosylmethionine-8-amino-7-oxononanoate aminotransferase